jgi:mono/diheme cytochrome c family protein
VRVLVFLTLVGCARQVEFDVRATQPSADYDPLRAARASLGKQTNPDPNIPPACYVATGGTTNSCAACHTSSSYPNLTNDWELQQNYPWTETSRVNPWRNQFRDRREVVARFTDDDVLAYIRTDNYQPLQRALAGVEFPGWRPDLDLARGFDTEGFANDGSGWRAVRYKPFVTFWPASGSAGDVFIRLPDEFRRDAEGRPSREVYRANLAILELAIARTDGELPSHYTGGAAKTRVVRALYPQGVEFMHTVRYLDPDAPGMLSRRLKEVRYAKKTGFLEGRDLGVAHRAGESPTPPEPGGSALSGLEADSWRLQGFIEDARGWLRVQTHEEHLACLGCHGALGVTVDRTFAFARKVPGDEGWRPQDPTGIPDAPQVGQREPEYAQYLGRTGAQVPGDISSIVFPTRAQAIQLDRAYLANVLEQSYAWGREAIVTPVPDAHAKIVERSTGLGEVQRVYRDVRLQLDWSLAPPQPDHRRTASTIDGQVDVHRR